MTAEELDELDVDEELDRAEDGECVACGDPIEDVDELICGGCRLDGFDVVLGRRVEYRQPLARYL